MLEGPATVTTVLDDPIPVALDGLVIVAFEGPALVGVPLSSVVSALA